MHRSMEKVVLTIHIVCMSLVCLAGCYRQPKNEDRSGLFVFPEEMKHCKAYIMKPSNARYADLRVVYCPNATTITSYREGKVERDITVISE